MKRAYHREIRLGKRISQVMIRALAPSSPRGAHSCLLVAASRHYLSMTYLDVVPPRRFKRFNMAVPKSLRICTWPRGIFPSCSECSNPMPDGTCAPSNGTGYMRLNNFSEFAMRLARRVEIIYFPIGKLLLSLSIYVTSGHFEQC